MRYVVCTLFRFDFKLCTQLFESCSCVCTESALEDLKDKKQTIVSASLCLYFPLSFMNVTLTLIHHRLILCRMEACVFPPDFLAPLLSRHLIWFCHDKYCEQILAKPLVGWPNTSLKLCCRPLDN